MTPTPQARKILLVDDSAETREILRRYLEARAFRIFTAASVPEALERLEQLEVELVVTDVKMPKVSGLDLVRHVRQNLRDVEVLVITGYPDVGGAVAALKGGAVDYLTKPFTEQEFIGAVDEALQRVAARQSARRPPARSVAGLLGESSAMRAVFEAVERASRTAATVLVSGESGTGKELVARAIHYQSARAAAPFVPVNCGAIPQELLESELFGHKKGAFTGATESRAGFFLTAEGGTIFLDEIGDTSAAMQVKLLRVLQDKQVRMVGAERTRTVDVRIIAATNKDLEALVRRGAFRDDLYYRINVIAIEVPPLREREEDITLLTLHFATKFARELDRPVPRFSDAALALLRQHGWPGNVRELENVVQRLVVMTDADEIDAPDLPPALRFSAAGLAGGPPHGTLAEMEAAYVRSVLRGVDGNKTRAAQVLGIDRKTLRAKLQQHGVEDDS